MTLPTVGAAAGLTGSRSRFRRAAAHRFPSFGSKLRQRLIERILQAPRQASRPTEGGAQPHSGGGAEAFGGAGLNLNELLASGRVREVIHVHDKDECELLRTRLVYGVAGICPMRPATIESLFGYSGASISFYFTYLSAYTRSLHLPALLGVVLWCADFFHFDLAVAAQQNATHSARIRVGEAAAAALANASE